MESPLDAIFILYDVGAIGVDAYRWLVSNSCERPEFAKRLGIDLGALGLDVLFLFLPGLTGGGPGLRLALAGGDLSIALRKVDTVIMAGRGLQAWYKGLQAREMILAASSSDQGQSSMPSNTPESPSTQDVPSLGVPGQQDNVRVIPGGDVNDARQLFDRLSEGSEWIRPIPDGLLAKMPDGSYITFKQSSSYRSGFAPTVYINSPAIGY